MFHRTCRAPAALMALAAALVVTAGVPAPVRAQNATAQAATAAPAGAARIGWVDAQALLDGTAAGKDIKRRVEAFRDSRQQVIDLEEQELKTAEEKLSQQGALLSEDARRAKEGEFQKKLGDYQKKVFELNKELQDKKDELLGEFNDVLTKAVKVVAAREGYDFVFDFGGDGSLLYGSPGLDLTDKVKAEIDAAAK